MHWHQAILKEMKWEKKGQTTIVKKEKEEKRTIVSLLSRIGDQ